MPFTSRSPARFIAIAAALWSFAVPAAARPITGLPEGNAQVVERERFLGFDSPYRLLAMSPDGNQLAFQWTASPGKNVWLGVIDLEARSLRLLTMVSYGQAASFSPDGSEIAFVSDAMVSTVDVGTAEVSQIAEAHRLSHVWWLDDGHIAYIDRERHLVTQDPPAPAETTPLTVPDPTGRDSLVANVAVSPDGTHALYARDCRPWLVDLTTGSETALSRAPSGAYRFWGYGVPPDAWSPDGGHFVVQKLIDDRCKNPGGPGWLDILFSGSGDRIGHILGDDGGLSHGHDLAWSTDSNWLMISMQPTGTQVGGIQQLWAVDLEQLTRSLVMRTRVASKAFVNDQGRLLVSRYDEQSGLEFHGAVISGRLQP